MKRSSPRRIVAAAALSCLLLIVACSSSDPVAPEPPKYKPLTDKENLITNLVQSYKDCNIDEYTKLLHADYVWYNQAEDVQNGIEPFYSRDQDITLQNSMFTAKTGTHPDPNKQIDVLSLFIGTGVWQEVTEIGGVPCAECYETTRPYYLTVALREGVMTYISTDLIHYVATAVQANGRKEWRILRADDIDNPQTP